MRIQAVPVIISTDAAGAGTALSVAPINGEVVHVRAPNAASALTTGGSADWAFTRENDGGTILAVTNAAAPFDYHPRVPSHSTTGGTSAYGLGVGPVYSGGVPVDGYVKLTIAQGALSQSGTVFIYYGG